MGQSRRGIRRFLLVVTLLSSSIILGYGIWGGGGRKRSPDHLHILSSPDQFRAATLSAFQESTGITVTVHHYEGNDALIRKLEGSAPDAFDLLFVDQRALDTLTNRKLIKRIPHEGSPPMPWDSEYGYPYQWELLMVGEVKGSSGDIPWNSLFTGEGKLAMPDDPYLVVGMGAHLLGITDP
ncbi:MAG: hypothetical protein VXZ72_00210, partial [Chlamydiota bacterium]|nr:hypothetical protein [Chlamydiota bacterium]